MFVYLQAGIEINHSKSTQTVPSHTKIHTCHSVIVLHIRTLSSPPLTTLSSVSKASNAVLNPLAMSAADGLKFGSFL